MSQNAEGPGWWLASDGKWYPPNLHPSVSPPPPPPSEVGVGRGATAPNQEFPGGSTLTTEAQQPNSWRYQPPSYPAPGYVPPAGYGSPASWAGNPNVVLDPVLQLPLAPWWKRVVALIIDGLVLGLGSFMLLFVIGILADIARGHPAVANTTTTSNNPDVFVVLFVFWIVACLPLAIYYGVMNGSRRGQTVGKMALSIAVRTPGREQSSVFGERLVVSRSPCCS